MDETSSQAFIIEESQDHVSYKEKIWNKDYTVFPSNHDCLATVGNTNAMTNFPSEKNRLRPEYEFERPTKYTDEKTTKKVATKAASLIASQPDNFQQQETILTPFRNFYNTYAKKAKFRKLPNTSV